MIREQGERGTIIFYGIPAYGHIHSNLYFVRSLAGSGFRVIYYATRRFRKEIEANGCEYRGYSLKESEIDLSDGSRLLRLYRLILTYTKDMLPALLLEAREADPCALIFDSLALWGRMTGELLPVKSFSFYSIAAINSIGDRGFWSYASGFSVNFLRYGSEIPEALRTVRQLKKTYGNLKLDILSALMNKGSHNLMGYSRSFQPGGEGFRENYTFLGPLSAHRIPTEINDFTCPDGPLIYVSLGTVFNQDEGLLSHILRQFGRGPGSGFHVIMAWDLEYASGKLRAEKEAIKKLSNFTVRPFVNQGKIMKSASLFISSGGMNSIHEALYYGVPCLLCPQQGEQKINGRQFEALGFGKILRRPENLFQEAMEVMKFRSRWNEKMRRAMTETRVEDGLRLFLNT